MDYKKIIIIIAVFVVLIVIGILQSGLLSRTATAELRGQTFKLEVARTEEQKQIGLSQHEKLEEDQGMIFIFDKPGNYSFWMKDMDFPIDIIFINEETIVEIFENQEPVESGTPPVITSAEVADKVLEINAGLSGKYGIKKGDKIKFSNL